MAGVIRAHFDGNVIVLDEPVDLPVDQPLELQWRLLPGASKPAVSPEVIEERKRRLAQASGRIIGPSIPLEALRRENLYDDRW